MGLKIMTQARGKLQLSVQSKAFSMCVTVAQDLYKQGFMKIKRFRVQGPGRRDHNNYQLAFSCLFEATYTTLLE